MTIYIPIYIHSRYILVLLFRLEVCINRNVIPTTKTIVTSAGILKIVDNESEEVVQKSLGKAWEGWISIIIAGQLSTVYIVDCIIIIHGKVVKSHTHSQHIISVLLYCCKLTGQDKQLII